MGTIFLSVIFSSAPRTASVLGNVWMYTLIPRSSLSSLAPRHGSRLSVRTFASSSRVPCASPTTTTTRQRSTTRPANNMFQVSDLLQKNQSWSATFAATKPELAKQLAQTQTPKILWIGCADSRVPESVVCDANPGDIFVTRNIANQFRLDDDNALSVLTFAV